MMAWHNRLHRGRSCNLGDGGEVGWRSPGSARMQWHVTQDCQIISSFFWLFNIKVFKRTNFGNCTVLLTTTSLSVILELYCILNWHLAIFSYWNSIPSGSGTCLHSSISYFILSSLYDKTIPDPHLNADLQKVQIGCLFNLWSVWCFLFCCWLPNFTFFLNSQH